MLTIIHKTTTIGAIAIYKINDLIRLQIQIREKSIFLTVVLFKVRNLKEFLHSVLVAQAFNFNTWETEAGRSL